MKIKDIEDIIEYLNLERMNHSFSSKDNRRIRELMKTLINERDKEISEKRRKTQ